MTGAIRNSGKFERLFSRNTCGNVEGVLHYCLTDRLVARRLIFWMQVARKILTLLQQFIRRLHRAML